MAQPSPSSFPGIKLPNEDTDEGALVRLLLVEVGSQPGDPDGVKEAMGLMKRVIENRLQRPQDFYANHATIRDVIRAHHFVTKTIDHKIVTLTGEQVLGFMDYPRLAHTQKNALDTDVIGATKSGKSGDSYRYLIATAISSLKIPRLQTRRRPVYTPGEPQRRRSVQARRYLL